MMRPSSKRSQCTGFMIITLAGRFMRGGTVTGNRSSISGYIVRIIPLRSPERAEPS
jgi:hypothetical protein